MTLTIKDFIQVSENLIFATKIKLNNATTPQTTVDLKLVLSLKENLNAFSEQFKEEFTILLKKNSYTADTEIKDDDVKKISDLLKSLLATIKYSPVADKLAEELRAWPGFFE